MRSVLLLIAVLAVVGSGGCAAVYERERIAWRYDDATDELQLLVFYEEFQIQRGAPRQQRVAAMEQISRRGGVLLDLLAPGDTEQRLQSMDRDTGRPLAEHAAEHVELRTLGYTRGPTGGLSLVQHVRIGEAEQWIARLNGAINDSMREGLHWLQEDVPAAIEVDQLDVNLESAFPEMPKTEALWRKTAEQGHSWLAFDGHAIVARFAVEPEEWAESEAMILDDPSLSSTIRVTDYDRDGQWVRMQFAEPDRPTAAVLPWDHFLNRWGDYRAADDELVRQVGRKNVDRRVVAAGPDAEDVEDEALRALLRWGPVEQYASSVLTQVEAGQLEADQAATLLEEWSQHELGRRAVSPPEVDADADPATALEGWANWVQGRAGTETKP